MSTEENKFIVRRYQEAYNTNHLDALDELVAADIISHKTTPGMPPGLVGGKQSHRATVAALPDLHYIIEALVAEEDRVAMRWTMTGTHTGAPLLGVPPSGRHLTVTGISIFRLAKGKIVEHWAEPDGVAFMRQLGVLPG